MASEKIDVAVYGGDRVVARLAARHPMCCNGFGIGLGDRDACTATLELVSALTPTNWRL